LQSVNQELLSQLQPEQVEVVVEQAQTDDQPGVDESERFGDVELRGEEDKPSMVMACD
jgi:hypothetical protein